MAEPASFDEENAVLDKPPEMSTEDCQALSVFRGMQQDGFPIVISCWKLTAEELLEVNRTGRIWLGVYGRTMPPAWIAGCKPFD